jgi:hypothetical protein
MTTMSDHENLLTRWSRRKSEACAGERETDGLSHHRDAEVPGSAVPPGEAPSSPDPASLPPLESIGAGTDIRAFLGEGVSAELTVAALRRSWSADPAIRDFIGLSENSWDFNAAGGIPGFGSLTPLDVQRLLTQALGVSEAGGAPAPTRATPPSPDQAATQAVECASGSQELQHPSASDPDQHVGHADVLKAASSDDVVGATSTAEPADGRNDRPASQRRTHGSARPRLDGAPG